VTIAGTLTGTEAGRLTIVLIGQPAGDGGVNLTSSQVSLGPPGAPSEYQGQVSQLQGTTLAARLTGPTGSTVTATIVLQLDDRGSRVSGTVHLAS